LIEVLEEDPTQAPSDVHTAQIIRLSNRRPQNEAIDLLRQNASRRSVTELADQSAKPNEKNRENF
jgi:hypothetical protein